MKVKTNGNEIRMFVVQPLYEEISKQAMDGKEKMTDEFGRKVKIVEDKFIKEIYLKLWFDKRDISPYGEYIGSKGKVLKGRSKIYCKATQNFYTVAHSLKELEEVLQQPNPSSIGFAKRPTNEV